MTRPVLRLLPPVASLAERRQQVRGEIERTLKHEDGRVHLRTITPDGFRIVEILTPDEARELAEDLVEAAKDAEGRR